uniref:Uncharacterized protein n=1 Tax=Brassica oleracea TaxID=3712 RepID=A0A3P6ELK1_BRAOL|nr:unnamed protein product [Brassica oleracea]
MEQRDHGDGELKKVVKVKKQKYRGRRRDKSLYTQSRLKFTFFHKNNQGFG